MAITCAKWIITLPNTVISGQSRLFPTSEMKLFVTKICRWKHSITVENSSVFDASKRLDPAIVNVILQLP